MNTKRGGPPCGRRTLSIMRLPVFSDIMRLDARARRFLFFTGCNVASWQCIVGPVLVLFARKLDMPASWVGVLLSFMPLSMVVTIATVPIVNYFGPKRLMLLTWMLRNTFMCSVFLMPWVIAHYGSQGAWYLLAVATLGFCLIRALGVGGWFPWLHEVVPQTQRGGFFSAETAIAQAVNVIVVFGQSLILSGEPGLNRFFVIYAVGISAGYLSLYLMSRVPGGEATGERFTLKDSVLSYGVALRSRPFLIFVLIAATGYSIVAWLTSSVVLYMRDGIGWSSWHILIVMALSSVGVFFTISRWGRFAEHGGSGHTMALTLVGHSASAGFFLLLTPGSPWTLYLLPVALVAATIFSASFYMAGHRAMLNYTQEEGKVGFTNLWILGVSLAMGVTPILVGQVINRLGFAGYQVCFLIAAVPGLACALASQLLVRDGPRPGPADPRLISPALPIRTLLRILWVTVGLHKSNRP